ncbi:MAG: hypothetical protein AAGI45_01750 [Cyanobacteria bacterium P01_H01_bin.26]
MRKLYLQRFFLALCSALVLATVPSQVLAGAVPVIETDSATNGQGDGFAAGALADQVFGRRVGSALLSTLQQIVSQGQVEVGGQILTLTPEEIQSFNQLLSNGLEADAAARFLAQQISEDICAGSEADTCVGVDIDAVVASAGNLRAAVGNVNRLVESLNRDQLIRAYGSAPLQAILQSLRVAVQTADGDLDELSALEGTESAVLILLKLL